jgi:hypothetical protein
MMYVSAGNREKRSDLLSSRYFLQDSTKYYYVKTESTARFFRDMENLSSVIQMIPKDIEIQVFEPIGDYYSAYYDGEYGFIPVSKVKPVNFDPGIFKVKPEALSDEQDKYTFLVGKYGQTDADQIIAGKVWKGMTKDMVLDSWGKPKKIDRYIGKTSVKEEWYYRSKVLFIRDGKLIGWK